MAFFLTSVLSMLVVLGIMVLVHEFGHFIVAKAFGVRVEVFSIGFGRRLFGFRRGDTDYRVSLLPLGGYVKMSGENPNEPSSGEPGEFTAHPRWQRMCIGLAGPVSNFLLAFVLITGYYMMHNEVPEYLYEPVTIDWVTPDSPVARAGLEPGDLVRSFDGVSNPTWEDIGRRAAVNLNQTVPVTVERQGRTIETALRVAEKSKGEDFDPEDLGWIPRVQPGPLEVNAVEPGMPAARAGLRARDRILSVDGRPLHSVQSMLAYLQQGGGRAVTLELERAGSRLALSVTPQMTDGGPGRPVYRLGFEPALPPFRVEQMGLVRAAEKSVEFNVENSTLIVEVLKRMVTRRVAVESLSGPIGIARQTGLAVTMKGWQPIIRLMSVISLNLGIFNLLPFPLLDGGLILMLMIESIMRRDINQQFKERIYQVAFVMLVLFAVFVMFNDVSKLAVFSRLHL
jgi:regulator of sigma E protease